MLLEACLPTGIGAAAGRQEADSHWHENHFTVGTGTLWRSFVAGTFKAGMMAWHLIKTSISSHLKHMTLVHSIFSSHDKLCCVGAERRLGVAGRQEEQKYGYIMLPLFSLDESSLPTNHNHIILAGIKCLTPSGEGKESRQAGACRFLAVIIICSSGISFNTACNPLFLQNIYLSHQNMAYEAHKIIRS